MPFYCCFILLESPAIGVYVYALTLADEGCICHRRGKRTLNLATRQPNTQSCYPSFCKPDVYAIRHFHRVSDICHFMGQCRAIGTSLAHPEATGRKTALNKRGTVHACCSQSVLARLRLTDHRVTCTADPGDSDPGRRDMSKETDRCQ